MSESTHLYRHFDAQNKLLYVGISKTALRRLAQHYSTAKWATSVSRVTIETFPTREAAKSAESLAIKTEGPIHNIQEKLGYLDGGEQITLRLPSDLVAAIDRYRQRTLPIPNRQDVIREVMAEWAKNNS